MEISLSLVCSVVLCIIGILTFAASFKTGAKGDGALIQKVDQALEGIGELKSDVKDLRDGWQATQLLVKGHDEQLKLLTNIVTEYNANSQVLMAIAKNLELLVERHDT